MSAPSSLCSFMTPADTQGMNTAAGTAPNIKTMLCAKEEQAQQDADAPMKPLKEANCKCKELAGKRQARDATHRLLRRSTRQTNVRQT